MEKRKLTAPQVRHYMELLGKISYRSFGDDTTYDSQSRRLLEQFFAEIKQIKPAIRNGDRSWTLWFHVDRGPIEDFGDYDEYYQDGEVKNRDEFEALWKDYFPDEEEWYEIGAGEYGDLDYRYIFVKHKLTIELDGRKPHQDMPLNITEFAEWLVDSLREVICRLKAGTYNQIVESSVPHQNRVGRIVRKDYWSIFPEEQEAFFDSITDDEVQEAIALMEKQPKIGDFSERIPEMTAEDFYHFCALGYAANQYKGADQSPRKQYELHADGRDEGLGEIELNSPEAFHDWLHDRTHSGGHPWEVCRGGNSTHISLQVIEDERGYYLFLDGTSESRCVEAIKFFLSLRHERIPVFMARSHELVARLRGAEVIGIVPEGVFPRYCSSMFPEANIIDYMNLPYENREDVVSKTYWEKIAPIYLASDSESISKP